MWAFTALERFLGQVLVDMGLNPASSMVAVCASIVSLFVGVYEGHSLPQRAYQVVSVKLPSLLDARVCRTRKRSKAQASCRNSAVRVLKGSSRLVVIVGRQLEVDTAAICRALDKHPYFATGGVPNPEKSAWHALRLHHRGRVLRAPEAACERLGSMAHQLWEPSQHLAPSGLVQRLHLLAHGVRCVGGIRDRVLVEEVAHLLAAMGKNPMHKRKELQQVQSLLHAAELEVDADLLACRDFLRPSQLPLSLGPRNLRQHMASAHVESLPSMLPEPLTCAMQKAFNQTTGQVQSVSFTTQIDRKLRKGAAASSTIRTALATWLESDDGKRWQEQRKLLFPPVEEPVG